MYTHVSCTRLFTVSWKSLIDAIFRKGITFEKLETKLYEETKLKFRRRETTSMAHKVVQLSTRRHQEGKEE
jgi:hypothetical protein